MNKYVILLALLVSTPLLAQDQVGSSINPVIQPVATKEQLEEQKGNLIKQGAQKDAEIAKLKQALAQTQESVAKRIEVMTTNLNKVRETEVYKACKAANGKTLISQDPKTGSLNFAGCLL